MKAEIVPASDVIIDISIDEAVYKLEHSAFYLNKMSGAYAISEIAKIVGWDTILIYAMKQLQIYVG